MKILFVLEHYYPFVGGVETLFKNLCERLYDKGHDVVVVTSSLPDTEIEEVLNGVLIERVKTPNKGRRYWFSFLSIPKIIEIARQADIISTTTYNGAFPAWIASKLCKKPCVITVHEIFGKQWNDLYDMNSFIAWLHRILEWMIINLRFTKYVGVSRATSKVVNKYGRGCHTIYNGIDYEHFNPANIKCSENNNFIYMYYGRPGISKGLEYLISAVRLIRDKIPNSKLILLLSREPEDRYNMILNMIDILDIKDNVILLASVPYSSLPEQIISSNCIVIPSISEGFGYTCAESCAIGVPVVASNVGSIPEVISGKYILVEPKNPKAIAQAVYDVYRNKYQTSELKKFTWDDCVDKYEKLYQCILA